MFNTQKITRNYTKFIYIHVFKFRSSIFVLYLKHKQNKPKYKNILLIQNKKVLMCNEQLTIPLLNLNPQKTFIKFKL